MPVGVYVRTDKGREAMRLAALRRPKRQPLSMEVRAKMSAIQKGRKLSDDHIAKIRAFNLKRGPHSEIAKEKIGAAFRGKTLSMEHRLKLSIAASGRSYSPVEWTNEERYTMKRIAAFMRGSLHRVGQTTRGTKRHWSKLDSILGYSKAELRTHLENRFLEGMAWENYGSVWNIDHIRPVVSFVRAGIFDPRIVNALENLQPLWKTENHRKLGRWVA